MYAIKKRFRKQFNLLLGLFSLALVVAIAACGGPETTTTEGGLPAEFRIGYQVIPNAELLAKNMGFAEARFPDVDIQWISFDSGRVVKRRYCEYSLATKGPQRVWLA